jgi:hypothetical protein
MRTLIGIVMLGLLALGCTGTSTPSASTVASPTASGPAPTVEPRAALTPVPAAEAASSASSSAAVGPALLPGIRADVGSCEAFALDLASTADAGILCKPEGALVESVAILRYPTQEALMTAYLAQVENNGVAVRSHGGRCEAGGPSEGAYTPGDGGATLIPDRSACYVDGAGKAHYLATISPWVMIQVTGTGPDPMALQTWAWRGNQDAPGNPTLWREPAARDTSTCLSRSVDFAADARGPSGDPVDLARAALSGLLPTDVLTRSTESTANDVTVVVTREVQEIGRVQFVRDSHGGWLLVQATVCGGLGIA